MQLFKIEAHLHKAYPTEAGEWQQETQQWAEELVKYLADVGEVLATLAPAGQDFMSDLRLIPLPPPRRRV